MIINMTEIVKEPFAEFDSIINRLALKISDQGRVVSDDLIDYNLYDFLVLR